MSPAGPLTRIAPLEQEVTMLAEVVGVEPRGGPLRDPAYFAQVRVNPLVKQEKATQTVLEQAEVLSAGWAAA